MTTPWHDIDDEQCRQFQSVTEMVGKRWNSAILLALAQGAHRFGEIRRMVPGLSDRLLAERARELQAAGLVEREVIPSTPVQIRYRLTDRGLDLVQSLQPLVRWGHRWPQSTPGASAAG